MKLWIARMWSHDLYIFKEKPIKNTTKGSWDSSEPMKDVGYRINSRWFPEITFENSPQEVEIKLIEDETQG